MNENNNTLRILIVEDIPAHADYTAKILQSEGFSVESAKDERQAMKKLQQVGADLLLMDIKLDNSTNGIHFCEKLRKHNSYFHVPIIFLTSSNDFQDKISGFRAGADDYLTKPFKKQELLARIDLAIQKKKLMESENRYRRFVENLGDMVFMLDEKGSIERVNKKVEQILALDRGQIIGKSIENYIEPQHQKEFDHCFKKILAGEEVQEFSMQLLTSLKSVIPVEIYGFVLVDIDQGIQVQLIMRDITERQKLQQEINRYTHLLEKQVEARTQELNETQRRLFLSEKMASVGQLAAGIAHEIRNPLSIIGTSIYYLNHILKDSKNKKLGDHLDIIQSEINRSQKIITNLLDFSRRSGAEKESVDINKIIRQTISLIERDLEIHDISTELDLQKLPFCFVNVDEIKQLFINLFINAKEAMSNGGMLQVKSYLQEKKWATVEVSDTGIGIDETIVDKVFDPFFSTKTDQNGIGLGLSLVHSSIQRNRGKIHVESKKGKGAKFIIQLPVYK